MSAQLRRGLGASQKALRPSALSRLQQADTICVEMDGDYLLVDHYGEKGVRRTMEDECVVHASLRSLNSDLPDAYNFTACGLFDGHGGRKTAEFARKYLFLEVAQELSQQLDAAGDDGSVFSEVVFKKSVNTACSRLDARIAKDLPDCHDGCTALLLFVSRNRVFVVNLGDSAAYLCRQLEGVIHAIPLSEVHKPWSPREKERILHYGGTVEGGRVNGLIEVSRSLGDLSMKRFGVKCTGTFRQAALDFSCDEFILMGCDGFWGVYDAQEACRTAMRFLRKEELRAKSDTHVSFLYVHQVCKDLVEDAIIEKRSQDNVSVILLRLRRRPG